MTKKSGAYYTPQILADFIVRHSLSSMPDKDNIRILEPSCGDGVFISSLHRLLGAKKANNFHIDAVEINSKALIKARKTVLKNKYITKFYREDYLEFFFRNIENERYDLIIGNPPYVIRKRLTSPKIKRCLKLFSLAGLSDTKFKNLWSAFLIASTISLSENGVLAYVLPAEFLQVKFSEEIRKFLLQHFEKVEIITFKEIIFDNIGQDTIILLGYKKAKNKGVYFSEIMNLENLLDVSLIFKKKSLSGDHSVKWTSHVLTSPELGLLQDLKKQLQPVSQYCEAAAGIVTAANDFFIVNDETLKKYRLEEFSKPIIQKGSFVNGSVTFTKKDFKQLERDGKPCHLLCFDELEKGAIPYAVKEYLKLGKEQGIHNRYKCLRRKPWYSIPGLWKTEGFFFKRSHLYPKILANEAKVMVTDSAYRIKMLNGLDINSLVYSFYNSLTLSLAEIEGRFYGGGVLELTPNEFKQLTLPYTNISQEDFVEYVERFERKETILDVLKDADQKILGDTYGIDAKDIKKLQSIRKKLTERRIVKGRS